MRSTLVAIVICISLLTGCSSDSSEDAAELGGPSFSFQIDEGGGSRTFSGTGCVFNSNFTDVKDAEGNDTVLNTVLVVAQDPATGETITFAITKEGDVKSGTHQIGTDIFSFYNAFFNYAKNVKMNAVDYQSDSGSITLSTVSSGSVAGTVSIQASGADGAASISGSFSAVAP